MTIKLSRRSITIAPPSSLSRLRLVTFVLASLSALMMLPTLVTGHQRPQIAALCAVLVLMLVAWWARCYRRGAFPLWGEPLQVACLLVLLHEAPGNPLVPLFGLLFLSLYGSARLAFARYAAWMAALLLAHASRGHAQVNADLARVVAVALVPALMTMLRSSVTGLESSERRLMSLVQNSTDVVTVLGADLVVRWQADSVSGVLGWSADELLRRHFDEIVHVDDRAKLAAFVADSETAEDLRRTLSLRLAHRDGAHRHFEVVIADRRHDESVGGYVLNMRDATERLRLVRELKELASRREHDALHDPLTGLPNRRSLLASLDHAIASAARDGQPLALLLLDLDRFKELNDTLGHHVGDQILREFRPRLQSVIGDALLARLGGDEFAVVMEPGATIEDARLLAERLRDAAAAPFAYESMTLLVEASVGVAAFPDHGSDRESLLKHADIAMYAAKREHLGHAVYSPGDDRRSREELALLGELPQALAGDQLILHYQPKFSLATGELTGVEALVRWQHPERGLLAPGVFLPVVEHTGMMRPLTLRVLDQAIAQAARWLRDGHVIPVAVNLSAPDLIDASTVDEIEQRLRSAGLPASMLQVEITERIIAADPVRVAETLARLRALGVTVALDDFGTGSSSLSYLRSLPVQVLKIDRSFVSAASKGDPADAALVRTIVALARDLGLSSVAEGIETDEDRELLASMECDEGQGFGLARPMPADQVVRHAPGVAALSAAG